jgi:PST family polysaccharide transporter
MDFTRSGIQRYALNTGWLFAGRVSQILIGLVVTIVVARYLGPQQFGLLNFVMAATFLLGVAANFGMDGIARRILVEDSEKSGKIAGTYFVLATGVALALYAAMAVGTLLLTEDTMRIQLFLILGCVFIAAAFRIIDLWFNARVASGPIAFATTLSVAVAGLLKLWLVYANAELPWFAAAILLESILLICLRMVIYKRAGGSMGQWRFDSSIASLFVKNGWLLMLSAVATNIYMKLDQVMLGVLIDDRAVGIYAAAVRLSTIWHFIPVILATSLFPAILKAKSESQDKYHCRLQQYFSLNTSLAYAIMIPIAFIGPFLIRWIYGDDFSQAGPILSLHIITVILAFLQIARAQYLLAEGFYKFILFASVLGAGVNIVLNLVLIPAYGGMGAAASTIIAQLTGIVLANYAYRPTRELGNLMIHSMIMPWRGFFQKQ